MAHAGVTIALRSSGVNSKAGPTDHSDIRDRFLVPRSKDTRVDFNAKRCRIGRGALETETSRVRPAARKSGRHTTPNPVDCRDRFC